MLKPLLTMLETHATSLEFLIHNMNLPQAFAARDKKCTRLIQTSLTHVLKHAFAVNWFKRPNFRVHLTLKTLHTIEKISSSKVLKLRSIFI